VSVGTAWVSWATGVLLIGLSLLLFLDLATLATFTWAALVGVGTLVALRLRRESFIAGVATIQGKLGQAKAKSILFQTL
jgi:hypothetical protein